MEQAPPASDRVRVRRLPDRGRYDHDTLYSILDEALVCHISLVRDGKPYAYPTLHARDGDTLLVHGSAASRSLRLLDDGVDVCVVVTLVDGLVAARSVFHHSVNYRSAIVFGRVRAISSREEKIRAVRTLVEHVLPGRWNEARPPTDAELKATLVLALPLDEASAKIRTGPPKDDEEDYASSIWAGVLPFRTVHDQPIPDPRLGAGVPVSESVRRWLDRETEGG